MRYVIFGAGAIGGLVGARLHQAGHDVMLIARGAHYEKLASEGLTLATPVERVTLQIPVAPSAHAAGLRETDIVLLCVKSQQTEDALHAIRDAAGPTSGASRIPIVCLQNAVTNEDAALRFFSEVYGAVVLIPAEHLAPGYVVNYIANVSGGLDVGRYPHGIDDRARDLCRVFAGAGFESEPREDIMRHKYAKLINNLVNGVQAVCGFDDPEGNRELARRITDEGREVLLAAGIEHTSDDVTDVESRWRRWGIGEVDGHPHQGGSTWQSVVRGTGGVETDYLNGEIVLLGRRLGISTPYNELIQSLTRATIVGGHAPGWRSAGEVLMAGAGD